MRKIRNNNSITNFYVTLVELISDDVFMVSVAEDLEKLFFEITWALKETTKEPLGFMWVHEDMTMKFFRELHEEYHRENEDSDLMKQLVEQAFEDLAPNMHDIDARVVFRRLAEMSGAENIEDLFAHVSNVRHFGDDREGMAVVTLVVSSFEGLKNLLEHTVDSKVEVVHLSSSK